MRTSFRIVLAATALLALTGCSGEDIAERLAEEAMEAGGGGEGEVDIDTDDGSVSVEGSEGAVNIGNQELPEELPDELPLPDGLQVTGSMSQDGQDGTTVGLQAGFEGSFDDATAFFDSELEAAGWTVTNRSNNTAGEVRNANYEIEGFGFTGVVGVTQLDGDAEMQTQVTVNLRSEATADSG